MWRWPGRAWLPPGYGAGPPPPSPVSSSGRFLLSSCDSEVPRASQQPLGPGGRSGSVSSAWGGGAIAGLAPDRRKKQRSRPQDCFFCATHGKELQKDEAGVSEALSRVLQVSQSI